MHDLIDRPHFDALFSAFQKKSDAKVCIAVGVMFSRLWRWCNHHIFAQETDDAGGDDDSRPKVKEISVMDGRRCVEGA